MESSSKDDIGDQVFTLISLIDEEQGIHLSEEEDKAGQIKCQEQHHQLADGRRVKAVHDYSRPKQIGCSDNHDDEVDDHVNPVQDGSSETLSYTEAVLWLNHCEVENVDRETEELNGDVRTYHKLDKIV